MQYAWRDGARNRGLEIDAVAPVLEKIERKHGVLTPDLVLREAQKKKSPLRKWFEWDDTEAARQYRLEQARELIRSVVVTFVGGGTAEPVSVRAYVHMGGTDSEYLDTVAVLSGADSRAVLLERARKELDAFRRKYEVLEELAEVFAAADRLSA